MATIPSAKMPDANIQFQRTRWPAMAVGDVGDPISLVDFQDRSVQITGTFGAGGSAVVEGSNDDGATWATLSDAQGVALIFSISGLRQITEISHLIRPRVAGGDGTTSLNAILLKRGSRP